MDRIGRKDFLGCLATLGLGAAGGLEARPTPHAAQQPEADAAPRRFREAWIATLMQEMEAGLDEKSRVAVMEACGRACARRSRIRTLAASCRGDVPAFVEQFAGMLGRDAVRLEGRTVHLAYPRCFCEMVAEGPPRLPNLYCRCSEGWVREVFATAAGKAVSVETLQTIKRGADSCRFRVSF